MEKSSGMRLEISTKYDFRPIISTVILSERGIPFCKNWGFPTLFPSYVTDLEFPAEL